MTYAERYGITAIKRHLHNGTRYFKLGSAYANGGVFCFNPVKFANDIGASVADFPFVIRDQGGWSLPAPPTEQELDAFLAARGVPQP